MVAQVWACCIGNAVMSCEVSFPSVFPSSYFYVRLARPTALIVRYHYLQFIKCFEGYRCMNAWSVHSKCIATLYLPEVFYALLDVLLVVLSNE